MNSTDFNFSGIIWIIFILMAFVPMFKQYQLQGRRFKTLGMLEKKRGSRVVALIHRQEMFSFFGFPLTKYISIDDSEQILRAVRLTPSDMPIDLILHTPGGLVLASEQIAHAIRMHPARVTVFVPHYAMSGGTLIALAADEIIMDPNAVLGPVDPQIGQYPAVSLIKVTRDKNINEIDDQTLILADVAQKALTQVRAKVYQILKDRLGDAKANEIADIFTEGRWTHDHPISCEELTEMGFPVCGIMPPEIYELMDLFGQPVRRQPNVNYIPMPYQREKKRY
jgi:ClpP class serine protease